MAIDFSKFDKNVDLEGLKNDVEEAENNEGGNYKEVPHGDYEVSIKKMELGQSKKGEPMFICWFKILEGEFKNSMLFMNQVVTQGFQISIVKHFLQDLTDGLDVDVIFESYSQFNDLILDIAEKLEDEREFLIEYGERKGYSTFKVNEVYNLD